MKKPLKPRMPKLVTTAVDHDQQTKMYAFRFRPSQVARWREAMNAAAGSAVDEKISLTNFVRIACELLSNRWLEKP